MKYFSKKIIYQGIKFDSKVERDRYILLKQQEQMGNISGLELQKEFELLPKQILIETVQLKTKTKQVVRVDEKAVKYHCDFFYFDNNLQQYIIEEIKSKMTAQIRDYPLRRKLIKLMISKMNERDPYTQYVFNEIVVK